MSRESVRRSEVGVVVSKKGLVAFAVGDKYVVSVGILGCGARFVTVEL